MIAFGIDWIKDIKKSPNSAVMANTETVNKQCHHTENFITKISEPNHPYFSFPESKQNMKL